MFIIWPKKSATQRQHFLALNVFSGSKSNFLKKAITKILKIEKTHGRIRSLSHMRSSRHLPSLLKQIRECVLPSRLLVLLALLARGFFSITGGAWSDKERAVIGWDMGVFIPEMLSRELSRLKLNLSLNIKSEPRLWLRLGISAASEAVKLKKIS